MRLSESRSKVSFDYAECEQSQDRKAELKEKGKRRNQKGEMRLAKLDEPKANISASKRLAKLDEY